MVTLWKGKRQSSSLIRICLLFVDDVSENVKSMFLGSHFHRLKISPLLKKHPYTPFVVNRWTVSEQKSHHVRSHCPKSSVFFRVLFTLQTSQLPWSQLSPAPLAQWCCGRVWWALHQPGHVCGSSSVISTPDLSCAHDKLTNRSVLQTKMYAKAHGWCIKTCVPVDGLEKSIKIQHFNITATQLSNLMLNNACRPLLVCACDLNFKERVLKLNNKLY